VWNPKDGKAAIEHRIEDFTFMTKTLWAYNDSRDVGQVSAWRSSDPISHFNDVFFITANDSASQLSTRDLIRKYLPELAKYASKFRGHASLVSNAKAKRVLVIGRNTPADYFKR